MSPAAKRGPPTSGLSRINWQFSPQPRRPRDGGPFPPRQHRVAEGTYFADSVVLWAVFHGPWLPVVAPLSAQHGHEHRRPNFGPPPRVHRDVFPEHAFQYEPRSAIGGTGLGVVLIHLQLDPV